MRQLILATLVVLAIGCSMRPTPTTPQELVDSWDRMGMWLPDENQIAIFRSHWAESVNPLSASLDSPNYEVRMRAGYVLEKLGRNALSLGPVLEQRLREEPDRLVRLYLYGAVRGLK